MTKEKSQQVQNEKSPKSGCVFVILILLSLTFILYCK